MNLRLHLLLPLLIFPILELGCDKNPVQPSDDSSVAWQQTGGPFGLSLYQMLSVAGKDYVESLSGLWFQSTDNGLTWTETKIFPKDAAAWIVEDGSIVASLWTEGGRVYHRSTNNGISWEPVSIPDTPSPQGLSISPGGVWFLAANQDGVYRSTNAGGSWTRYTTGLEFPNNPTSTYKVPLVEVLQLGDSICLGNVSSLGPRRSIDLGATWSITALGERFVLEMFVLDDHTVLLGTDKAIFRSSDRGLTWDSVSSKGGFSIARKGPGERLFALTGNGLATSVDNGLTWMHVDAPLSYGRMSVNASGTIYIGDQWYGPYRSTNDGQSWEPTNQGIVAASVTELVAVGNTLLAYHNGASRSTDLGATWTSVDVPLQSILYFFHFAASRGDTVYAGASGVQRSTDAGLTWHELPSANGQGTVTAVAADRTGQVFFSTYNGRVFRSIDGGFSWTLTNQNTYVYPVHELASNGNGIVLMSDSWNALALSTNNGTSWTPVRTLPSEHRSVAVAPDGTLLVGNFDGLVYRSTDLGATWQTKLLSNSYGHNVTAFSFGEGKIVLASCYGGGVYVSRDNGDSWAQANDGFPLHDVPSIVISASGHAFAGTAGASVFRSTAPVR